MSELISVILPAYNAEQFIKESVESILAQTYNNIELIIVNDGSTDGTARLSEELAVKDSRIKVIHQENQGVSAARNNGLKTAKGNFIGFIDADDQAAEDLYELLYKNIKKYDADISHCGFELVKPHETVKFHDSGDLVIHNKMEALKALLSGKKVEPGVWNKLYRKFILTNVFFPVDIKVNEDLLFNILAFKNANKSVFEDVVKYRYRFVSGSASRNPEVLKQACDVFKVAKRIKTELTDPEIKNAIEFFYAGKLLNILKIFKSEKYFKTEFAGELRRELRMIDFSKMSLRIRTLRSLLLDYPLLYDGFIFIYNLVYSKNQKWK
ncbi:hypothetical protein CBW16_03655 [Flavobacteriaceae bacterium JJC]|nr:hypothetical protein CBW16_03655 [Flavobacteriaceae bacterium JJC]